MTIPARIASGEELGTGRGWSSRRSLPRAGVGRGLGGGQVQRAGGAVRGADQFLQVLPEVLVLDLERVPLAGAGLRLGPERFALGRCGRQFLLGAGLALLGSRELRPELVAGGDRG